VVVAESVDRRERPVALVVRRRPDELVRRRARQRVDGMLQAELRECLGLTGPRTESGAPEESLRLLLAERPVVLGHDAHPDELKGTRQARLRWAAVRRLTLVLVAAAVLAAPASGATPSQILATTLKPVMQQQFKSKVKGLVFTKLTCVVPAKSKLISGRCRAAFAVKRYNLLGVYQVVGAISSKGRLTWHTTSVTCTDARTHKRIRC
jgi:hypothetical protein